MWGLFPPSGGGLALLVAHHLAQAGERGDGALPLDDRGAGHGCLGRFVCHSCAPAVFLETRNWAAVCQCLQFLDLPGQPLGVLRVLHRETEAEALME